MYQQRVGTERKNMQENTLTNGRFTDAGYTTVYPEQWPELSEVDLHRAANPDSVAFMADFLKNEESGRYSWFERLGFTLQNAGAGVLRCRRRKQRGPRACAAVAASRLYRGCRKDAAAGRKQRLSGRCRISRT